jgi:hypothetical protein
MTFQPVLKGNCMDQFQSKVIGYAIVAVIAATIIHAFLPYFICGLIGWIVVRAYENKHK